MLFSPFQYFVEVNEDPRGTFLSIDGFRFMSREFSAEVRALMGIDYPEPSALFGSPSRFPRHFILQEEGSHRQFFSSGRPREFVAGYQPTGDVTPGFQFGIHSGLFPTSRERLPRRQTCHASSSEGSSS